MSRYEISHVARREMEEIVEYIAADSPQAAQRFVIQCHETFARLAELPHSGRPWPGRLPRARGVRQAQIHGFRNYLVFYRPRKDDIVVTHVTSGSRNLWRILRR